MNKLEIQYTMDVALLSRRKGVKIPKVNLHGKPGFKKRDSSLAVNLQFKRVFLPAFRI